MENKKERNLTKILFIVYLIILTWLILFKMQVNLFEIGRMQYRNINLIPFQGSVIVNGKIELSEIILNVLVFVPFGVYISMYRPHWNFSKKAVPIFLTSFVYEMLQYIFAIGASDITDLIGNTLGGILGIFLFWLLSKVLKENTIKTVNILAGIGTILVLMLITIVIVANI